MAMIAPIRAVTTLTVVGLLTLSACGGGNGDGARKSTSRRPTSVSRVAPTPPSTTTPATRSTTVAVPAGGPVPAGFHAFSFTAVSEVEWWLLGEAPCAQSPCTSIVRTNDGGSTFVGLAAPPVRLAGTIDSQQDPSVVGDLRFADPADGFAYGPALWATHDGGSRWQQVSMTGRVSKLAAADGYVFAVVGRACTNGGGCTGNALYRSPVGTDNWSPLDSGDVRTSLAVHGPDVVVETSGSPSSPTQVLISHDHGVHFTAHPSPAVGLPCSFDEPDPATVWALCATGMQAAVTRSTDGGTTFPQLQGNQAFVNSATLGAASAMTAVVASLATGAGSGLYLTTDGGRTYRPTGPTVPHGAWLFVGFTDASRGVALADTTGERTTTVLYRTIDGGRTWSPVTIG